jgi:hypothetical protein
MKNHADLWLENSIPIAIESKDSIEKEAKKPL